jgi:hypothetical protein
MIRVDIIADTDILLAIEDAARKAPGLMTTVYTRAVNRMRPRILARLKINPGSPRYPIRWKSAKQRRYVMAKLRREGNLPYKRTGDLLRAYDVQVVQQSPTNAIFEVINTDPKARFVVGDDAQPMHLDSGWVQIADVVSNADLELQDILIDAYFTTTDIFAGVPK